MLKQNKGTRLLDELLSNATPRLRVVFLILFEETLIIHISLVAEKEPMKNYNISRIRANNLMAERERERLYDLIDFVDVASFDVWCMLCHHI